MVETYSRTPNTQKQKQGRASFENEGIEIIVYMCI